jgi:hypothetical protein
MSKMGSHDAFGYFKQDLDEGYNFVLDLTSIRGIHEKLWAFQSCGSPHFGNFGTPNLGVPRQNDIWM